MNCCRCECGYLSVIIGIIAGVVLGVLYSLGFVATGILFWVYLLVGFLGVFLAPVYAEKSKCSQGVGCFCYYRRWLLTAIVGSIIAAAVGLIIVAFAPVIAIAISVGVATFFIATLIVLLVCLARCICNS
mgnify:CR=1 FL=1